MTDAPRKARPRLAVGRLAGWVLLDAAGPVSLTLACRVESLARPGDLAERLPKALIHHNVRGEPIHALLRDLDAAWAAAGRAGLARLPLMGEAGA